MWPLKSAQLQQGPTNITSFASPCHPLNKGRVETEEGLSTRGQGHRWQRTNVRRITGGTEE